MVPPAPDGVDEPPGGAPPPPADSWEEVAEDSSSPDPVSRLILFLIFKYLFT